MSSSQKTVYQSIIEPLLPLLQKEVDSLKGEDNYTLSLYFFSLNLCYAIIAGIRSIRLLRTEAKTSEDAQKAGVIDVSSSMYSEAFSRYSPMIFRRLFLGLLEHIEFKEIPELKLLGRFMLVDGSIFPAIRSMDWASYKKTANGIKLHLAFELNRMIPVQFISTDANGSEKKALQAFLEAGVTYIADRGYVSFQIFSQIVEQAAFFIIRIKSNMEVIIDKELPIDLPESWKAHLSAVTDHLVVFKGDPQQKTYRLITFEAFGELYRITTNRLDLNTHEIIMLYAYRWQIELFFRCLKRCFNGLHLWTHDPKGVEIQFYLYMIVYLLLLRFKQASYELEHQQEENDNQITSEDIAKTKESEKEEIKKEMPTVKRNNVTRTPDCGIVTLLSEKLKGVWKIGIHWLTTIKNKLFSIFNLETAKL